MTERELKPCPFCGGNAKWVETAGRAACLSKEGWCQAEIYADTQKIATERWNTRADPLLQEAITLLERTRDNLLYPAEKRIKSGEISEFIRKVNGS